MSSKIGCRIDSVQFARLLVWLNHGSRLCLRIVRAAYGPWQVALRDKRQYRTKQGRYHESYLETAASFPLTHSDLPRPR